MNGIEVRTVLLSAELEDNRVEMGPWEVATPGVAILLENNSQETAVVYIEGAEDRGGTYIIGYGADSPITLVPGGRVVTTMDPLMVNSIVAKFIGFRLSTAITTGLVRINVIGFSPLPECQMTTATTGTVSDWWN